MSDETHVLGVVLFLVPASMEPNFASPVRLYPTRFGGYARVLQWSRTLLVR